MPLLDHRPDKSRGFSPGVIIAQIVFSFCTGGINIEDAGRLAADTALGQLLGLPRMAGASTINLWLNRQSREGSDALWKIIREFVSWVLARAPKEPLLHKRKLDVFSTILKSKWMATTLKTPPKTTRVIAVIHGKRSGPGRS